MVHLPITFRVNYITQPGQTVYVVGRAPELGSWDPSQAPALTWSEGGNWIGVVFLQADHRAKTSSQFYLLLRHALLFTVEVDISRWCCAMAASHAVPDKLSHRERSSRTTDDRVRHHGACGQHRGDTLPWCNSGYAWGSHTACSPEEDSHA
eukprot:Rmarinus@m.2420